jgi:hypothetical protein
VSVAHFRRDVFSTSIRWFCACTATAPFYQTSAMRFLSDRSGLLAAVALAVAPPLAVAEGCAPRAPADKGAFWNQDAYDRALHAIEQPREATLAITARVAGAPASGQRLRVCTLRTPVIGGDRFVDYTLDQQGHLRARHAYGNSLIEVLFERAHLPAGSGIDILSFAWFASSTWIEGLSLDVDLSAFRIDRHPPDAEGRVVFDIHYDPALEPQRITARFGSNGWVSHTYVSFEPGVESPAKIARGSFLGPGRARVSFEMATYLDPWERSFPKPRLGTTYQTEIEAVLVQPAAGDGDAGAPPRRLLTVTPSSRADPPFIPPPPRRRRDSWEGNPYVVLPSTKPFERVTITVFSAIEITRSMLR